MFSKSHDDTRPAPAPASAGLVSVLATDLVITGKVMSEGTVELHGQIDGELAATNVVIGHDGRMQGRVQAGQVDLRGRMDGQIDSGSLTLRATARLRADTISARLVIEAGAEVEGRFTRPAPVAPQASIAAAPAPIALPAAAPVEVDQTDNS